MVRASSGGNGYGVYVNATNVLILSLTAGSGSIIGSTTCTSVSGNVYKIDMQGTTITVYQNGTSCGSATDSTYSSGLPGLFIDNTGQASAAFSQASNFMAGTP